MVIRKLISLQKNKRCTFIYHLMGPFKWDQNDILTIKYFQAAEQQGLSVYRKGKIGRMLFCHFSVATCENTYLLDTIRPLHLTFTNQVTTAQYLHTILIKTNVPAVHYGGIYLQCQNHRYRGCYKPSQIKHNGPLKLYTWSKVETLLHHMNVWPHNSVLIYEVVHLITLNTFNYGLHPNICLLGF